MNLNLDELTDNEVEELTEAIKERFPRRRSYEMSALLIALQDRLPARPLFEAVACIMFDPATGTWT